MGRGFGGIGGGEDGVAAERAGDWVTKHRALELIFKTMWKVMDGFSREGHDLVYIRTSVTGGQIDSTMGRVFASYWLTDVQSLASHLVS